MNKSKIEWCDYTVNPVKGLCPVGCSYCYARAMYHRFKWNPKIRYNGGLNFVKELCRIPRDEPRRVFVGSTMELFGPWVNRAWLTDIIDACGLFNGCHIFIFLTKMPERLPREWPNNCWVGVTATDEEGLARAIRYLAAVDAAVKFISLEPLLKWSTPFSYLVWESLWRAHISWLIIGQQTPVQKSTMPKTEWISEIVDAADKAGVPVFLKDNLFDLVNRDGPEADFAFDTANQLRQEFPTKVATIATGHNTTQEQEV